MISLLAYSKLHRSAVTDGPSISAIESDNKEILPSIVTFQSLPSYGTAKRRRTVDLVTATRAKQMRL